MKRVNKTKIKRKHAINKSCNVSKWSSSICNLGTKGCITIHYGTQLHLIKSEVMAELKENCTPEQWYDHDSIESAFDLIIETYERVMRNKTVAKS